VFCAPRERPSFLRGSGSLVQSPIQQHQRRRKGRPSNCCKVFAGVEALGVSKVLAFSRRVEGEAVEQGASLHAQSGSQPVHSRGGAHFSQALLPAIAPTFTVSAAVHARARRFLQGNSKAMRELSLLSIASASSSETREYPSSKPREPYEHVTPIAALRAHSLLRPRIFPTQRHLATVSGRSALSVASHCVSIGSASAPPDNVYGIVCVPPYAWCSVLVRPVPEARRGPDGRLQEVFDRKPYQYT